MAGGVTYIGNSSARLVFSSSTRNGLLIKVSSSFMKTYMDSDS